MDWKMPKSPLKAWRIIKSTAVIVFTSRQTLPTSNTPDTTENDEEKQEEETLNENWQKSENDGTEFKDCENDRSQDELYGCKVKGLYEYGWFTGTIQYFNKKLGKCRVLYNDGSEDYIGIEEIEGVEIVLLD